MPSILIQLDDATYRALNQIPQPLNGNGPSSSGKPSRRQFESRNTSVFVRLTGSSPIRPRTVTIGLAARNSKHEAV